MGESRRIRIATIAAASGLVVAGVVIVSGLAASSMPSTPDAVALRQLVADEERDAVALVVVPATGPMRYGDYAELMAQRTHDLERYYTGRELASHQASLRVEMPIYPPEKLAALASAGETPPALATPAPDATLDPQTRPIAAAVSSIEWRSLAIDGETARGVAVVDSWTDWRTGNGGRSTTRTNTHNVTSFDFRRVGGEWKIEQISVELSGPQG